MGTYIHLPLSELRFSQDSLGSQLGDGRDLQRVVNDLLAIQDVDARLQRLLSADFGAIFVMHHETLGSVSFDNRRLLIYNLVLPQDYVVPVYIMTEVEERKHIKKLTTKNGGVSVRIRAAKKK